MGYTIHVKEQKIKKNAVREYKIKLSKNKSIDYIIDKAILSKDYNFDKRILTIKKEEYKEESYQLLRYHLNYYFEKNKDTREQILGLVEDVLYLTTTNTKN